jgi:hypothetical protein
MVSALLLFLLSQELQETLTVRRVELDVRVLDLAQRPVLGLSQADFSLSEAGVSQKIRNLEEVNFLDLAPGESFDTPRLLLLFNFLDDARQVKTMLDQCEAFLLHKDLGAWQLAMGYAVPEGLFMVGEFSADQDRWIESLWAIRSAYATFDRASLFVRGAGAESADATHRMSTGYGFQQGSQSLRTSEGDGMQANLVGQDSENFAQPATPTLRLDPRAISRFVRLLRCYYGIKEVLVLGPALWDRSLESRTDAVPIDSRSAIDTPNQPAAYALSNSTGRLSYSNESGFDLNQLLTLCIRERIRFSRLALGSAGGSLQDEIVTLCGGFLYPSMRSAVANNLESFLDQAGHFYRIAYQVEFGEEGDRYRRVNVGVKGFGRSAVHVGRYYPSLMEVGNALGARLTVEPIARLHFAMPWNALSFESADLGDKAQLGLAKRIFLNQRLVFEQVEVLTPMRPTSAGRGGNMSAEELTVQLDLPVFEEGSYRVEFVAIDLINGRESLLLKQIEL